MRVRAIALFQFQHDVGRCSQALLVMTRYDSGRSMRVNSEQRGGEAQNPATLGSLPGIGEQCFEENGSFQSWAVFVPRLFPEAQYAA